MKTCYNCSAWLTVKDDVDKTNPHGFCIACRDRLTRAAHADPTSAGHMLYKLWQLRTVTVSHG